MIILDTNVVSEPMRPELDARVLVWLADQDVGALFTTAVTEAELRTGFAIMPEGRRREALGAALEAVLVEDFARRVLPFEGGAAARAYAAIARARGAQVATRNVSDFAGTGVEVINPWA